MSGRFALVVAAWVVTSLPALSEPVPQPVQDILYRICAECHDADSEKGGVNLDKETIAWDK